MGSFDGLLQGFQLAFSLQGIMFVFIGVLIGTIIGMIPGLGPISAIAIMIPVTYGMDPTNGDDRIGNPGCETGID